MCDLCNLDKLTTWYYEDDDIVVCDCIICKIPMVVAKKHTMRPGRHIEMKMIVQLNKTAVAFYGDTNYRIDTNQRKIPDHIHWHARPK